jgi:hypothetical protein
MVTKPSDHYDAQYYEWQGTLGQFGGTANLIKFESLIEESDNVVDFGCGGGFLLANLTCKDKIGVEVNAVARKNCERLNVKAVESIDDVPEGWADKIISNHALEHVDRPFELLLTLRSKLKPMGRLIFVVPCESVGTKYVSADVHKHLFTWSPRNLGNLFESAGYETIECKAFHHRWIPKCMAVQKLLGWKLFHKVSRAYGFLFRGLSQVRIIAAPAGSRHSGASTKEGIAVSTG